MKKSYFYGIYGIRFIWHGEWSDPEIIWHGKSFNYYDLENTLWSYYQEEQNPLDFEIWVKKNAALAREILQNLLDYKCFYGGIKQC
jgi:hypothetical protein